MEGDEVPVTRAIRKVAVIGIGRMGDPMARRIAAAGFELTVCDTDAGKRQDFAAQGARIALAPRECADCDAVVVLVATSDQVRSVTLGTDGVRQGMSAGGPRYLVIMSTVAPQDVRTLASSLESTGTQVVDAPVSGGIVAARKGVLTVLAGGTEAAVSALRPLFEAVGEKIFHCGAVGAGQTTKIVNNVIAISNMMISAEAYRIALANGLTLEQLVPALEAGSGRNFLSRDATLAAQHYAVASASEQDAHAIQTTNRKDIDLALSIGTPVLSLPAVAALRELLDTIGEETLGHWRALGGQGA